MENGLPGRFMRAVPIGDGRQANVAVFFACQRPVGVEMTSVFAHLRQTLHSVIGNSKPIMLAGLLAASSGMTAGAHNQQGEEPEKTVVSSQVLTKFSDLDYSLFDRTKPEDRAIARKIFGDMVQYALEEGITGERYGQPNFDALKDLSQSKVFVQDAHDYPGITSATYVAYRDAIVPIVERCQDDANARWVRDPAKVKASAIRFAMSKENLDKAFDYATVVFTNSAGKKITYESMLGVEASSSLYVGLARKAKSSIHSAVIEHFVAKDNGDWTRKALVPLMEKAYPAPKVIKL